MDVDDKVKAIMEWQESVTAFNDDYFFEIVRIYLGPIKTPFNKQNVVKDLALFLRREDNIRAILSLLDEDDCKILSAMTLLTKATARQLRMFFNNEGALKNIKNTSDFYERLANLEDRLIIYHTKTETETVLKINPILQDSLIPVVKSRGIFMDADVCDVTDSRMFLTPEYICSVISYVNMNRDLFRQDGTFKKKNITDIEQIFGEDSLERTSLLIKSFKGLGLLKEEEKEVVFDWPRLTKFASLNFFDCCILLCCGAVGHFMRSTLYSFARLLKSTWFCVQGRYFKKETLIQAASLINSKMSSHGMEPSRFSSMMSRVFNANAASTAGYDELLVDAAIRFGLFSRYGDAEDGTGVYCSDSRFLNYEKTEDLKNISVDAMNRVTVMPGLSMEQLLPLIQFLQVVKVDTAAVFELTRQSVSSAFDNGCTESRIFTVLEQHSMFPVPQSLRMNVQDWAQSYSSGSFYEGYVLKVDKKDEALVEENPRVRCHIYEKLAPGIYLLSFESREEAVNVIKSSGLDFVGRLKNTSVPEREQTDMFQSVSVDYSYEGIFSSARSCGEGLPSEKSNHNELLKQKLFAMDISKDQMDCLLGRIENNLIVNEEQLRPQSVRFERTEASAMDHTGKIQILESAIENSNLVRLTVEGFSNEPLVRPVAIDRHSPDAYVVFIDQELEEERRLPVRRIGHIKKIRNLFSSKAADRW